MKLGTQSEHESELTILASDLQNPTYAVVQLKVIGPYCLECHSAANGNQGDVNLETYQAVRSLQRQIKSDLDDNSMPKNRPRLTPEQKRLFISWLELGAPEVWSTEAAPPSPA